MGIALGVATMLIVYTVVPWFALFGTIWASSKLLGLVAAAGQVGTVLLFCLLLPNAPIPRNRRWVGAGIVIVSYIWGIGLWMFATLVLFNLWGTMGIFLGVLLLGIGSVPLACVALVIAGEFSAVGQIVLAAATIFAVRILGRWIESKAPRRLLPSQSNALSLSVSVANPSVLQGRPTKTSSSSGRSDASSSNLSESDATIIDAYVRLLTAIGERNEADGKMVSGSVPEFRAEAELPFPKSDIQAALLRAAYVAGSPSLEPPKEDSREQIWHYRLCVLETFVPGSDVVPTQELYHRVRNSLWPLDRPAALILLYAASNSQRHAIRALFETVKLARLLDPSGGEHSGLDCVVEDACAIIADVKWVKKRTVTENDPKSRWRSNWNVIEAFQRLVESRPVGVSFSKESDLPFSADRIRAALLEAREVPVPVAALFTQQAGILLRQGQDPFETFLFALDTFVPDSELVTTTELFQRLWSIQSGDRLKMLTLSPGRERRAIIAVLKLAKRNMDAERRA